MVVLPPRAMFLDVAGPLEVLRRANAEQSDVYFSVRYVSAGPTLCTSIGLSLEVSERLPSEISDDAMVLVVGSVDAYSEWGNPGDHKAEQEDREQIVGWLRKTIRPAHKVVSICDGAMLLAEAGLLNGRSCTTHYLDCDHLALLAPRANVLTDRLYVQDGNIYTSAGVTAGVDLMLYLVHEMVSPECTLAVARYLVVYLRRSGSDPQLSPWLQGRSHIHPAVHRVQNAIVEAPAQRWTRSRLARLAGASERHLSRLFQEHVGMSLLEYRNRIRVAMARELLSQSGMDIEQVAEKAGFESARQLRRAWSRVYPGTPRHARRTP